MKNCNRSGRDQIDPEVLAALEQQIAKRKADHKALCKANDELTRRMEAVH